MVESFNLTRFLSGKDVLGDELQSIGTISLINYLILTYFSHFFGVCIVRTRDDSLYHTAPVPTIVLELNDQFEESFSVAVEVGCQSFVVTERTVDAFFDAFFPVHEAALQRSTEKRLLMVLDANSSVFRSIHQMLVLEELPEVLILLPTPCSEAPDRVELYTVDFSDGDPITIHHRLIGVIDTQQHESYPTDVVVNLFPDKFVNMNKRRLRLGTVFYLPNAAVEEMPLGEGNARYILPPRPNVSARLSGTELWFVVLFCEMVNCTSEVMIASDWGNAYENGTKLGLIGAPVRREVDLILGGLYTWYTSFRFLAFTAVHSRAGCTCIVPKPYTVTNWRTPFLSFTGSLWCAVFLAFVFGAVAVLHVSRYRQRILRLHGSARYTVSDSVLIMIGFFMEQTVRMPNELVALCVLYSTLMFAGFMIGSAYNGGLASTMIVPQYERSINSVHDLASTRTTWVGVTVTWIFSIQLAYQPDILTLLETFQAWDEDKIARHSYDRDVAIIIERMEYGHFAHPRLDVEAMKGRKMMAEDIYWESVVGMSSKTWPGRARFDRMLHELKSSGILSRWELLAVAKHLSLKTQQIIHSSRETIGDDYSPLRVANLTGSFVILFAGLSIAVVVFFAEVLWHKFDPWLGRRVSRLRAWFRSI